jgi:predicted SAM-dependent methyltransferase
MLHLACGFTRKHGWVNIDLLGAPVDIAWNLETGLPFPDDSVDSIFHEHLIEHIPIEATFQLTRECLRVLKPGGVLRVAVPDAGLLLRSYAGQADSDWAESRATPMMSVESLFYEHKHVAMYDSEKLRLLLEVCGLTRVEERQYHDSQIEPPPDSEHRAGGTLYVEGVKPACWLDAAVGERPDRMGP